MRIGRLDVALAAFIVLGLTFVALIFIVPDPPPTLAGDFVEQQVMDTHRDVVEADCPDRPFALQDRFECAVTLSDGSAGSVRVTQVGEGFLAVDEVETADD